MENEEDFTLDSLCPTPCGRVGEYEKCDDIGNGVSGPWSVVRGGGPRGRLGSRAGLACKLAGRARAAKGGVFAKRSHL